MKPLIEVKNLVTKFGDRVIHDDISFEIYEKEIFGILGGSGSGKSVLVKEIIMLLHPFSGKIAIFGKDISTLSFQETQELKRSWGVLFQFGALFTSLTIAQNIAMPLIEYTTLSKKQIEKIVAAKLELVGLKPFVASMYPSELSGGMIKRAALARALALDPKLLFLDEPTSGLDPVGARNFDRLIKELRDILDLTVVMITHDLDSIFGILDRMLLIADKKIAAYGTIKEVLASTHPFVEKKKKNDFVKKRYLKDLNV